MLENRKHLPWASSVLVILCALLAPCSAVHAQGGPPMVTDDPGTPGDGNWEINLASEGQKTRPGWLYTIMDADINYGWGERLQLKLDTPYDASRQGGAWATGIGTTLAGVKWRFFDDDKVGWAVSIYPQLGFNPDSGAVGRGLASPGKSLFLPVESTTHLGPIDIDMEAGRQLQQTGADSWIAGIILAHTFASHLEVMAEAREHWATDGSGLLLNLGSRWELSEHLTLLAALGREVGAADDSRLSTLAYLGMQIRH